MSLKIKKSIFSWETIFSYSIMFVVAAQILFPLKINIYIANLFIYLMLGLFGAYVILKRETKIYFNTFLALFGLFVLWSAFSIFWSIDVKFTQPVVIREIFLFVTIFVIFNIIKRFNNEYYILYGILVGAYFNFLIALNLINYTTPFTNELRFTGTLARSNDVAIAMIITLISAFILLDDKKVSSFWKKASVLSIPLALYVIFLTVSKKGIIFGTFLTSLYFIDEIKNNFKKFIFFLVAMSGGAYILFKENMEIILEKVNRLGDRFSELDGALKGSEYFGSTADRLRFIKEGVEFFSNHPIVGTGLNTFIVQDSSHFYSHNNYIEMLVGLGLVGFLLYYSIHFVMFYKLFKIKNPKYKKIRNFIFVSLIVFLFMDSALVSYSYKLVVLTLFFMYIYIENINSRIYR